MNRTSFVGNLFAMRVLRITGFPKNNAIQKLNKKRKKSQKKTKTLTFLLRWKYFRIGSKLATPPFWNTLFSKKALASPSSTRKWLKNSVKVVPWRCSLAFISIHDDSWSSSNSETTATSGEEADYKQHRTVELSHHSPDWSQNVS